jgi:single-strand DNA-binding protein
MNEITIHGHVGNTPRIFHSGAGQAAVRFSLAVSNGYYDRRSGQWRDAPAVWHDVVAFGELANHVYDTLTAAEKGGKGTLLTVTGSFADNSYTREASAPEAEDIVIRRIQLRARDVAVSLRRATAVITKKTQATDEPTPAAAAAHTPDAA